MERDAVALGPAPHAASYRLVGWICLFVALVHIAAMLVNVILIREGNLADLSPMKLLQFVPRHLTMWRVGCFAAAAASISFLAFVVAMREVTDRRLQMFATFAVALTAVALASDLSGQLSMMVLFSDLAHQLRGHGSFLQHETVQLAWMTLNQALTASGLVANTLYSVAGLFVVGTSVRTRGFPRLLAWLGLPIWITYLCVSGLIFSGMMPWAVVLFLAATIAFTIWTTVLGFAFLVLGRGVPVPEPPTLDRFAT